MIVNFEFLGNEPIENVITCLHFKVDKVVYFGYHSVIEKNKKCTEDFLKKYCGVTNVVFCPLSQNNLQAVIKAMRKEIEFEKGQGGKVYFDITGGESLILVAFGMLSKEFKLPMHMYDVVEDRLIEFEESADTVISKYVPKQSVELNLDRYIEMRGGVINYGLQKNIKTDVDDEFASDVSRIWQAAQKNYDCWNPFSDFVRANLNPGDNLTVSADAITIRNALIASGNMLNTVAKLNVILDDLEAAGVLLDVVHADGRYSFRFKNQSVKDCIFEGGSILELHTYQNQRMKSSDCRVGVHLDWDGVIHDAGPGNDVLNEIDVLAIDKNVPTFISCKSGKPGAKQALNALYELDTVAGRFGGKYAKKVLVTTQKLGEVYLKRAEEMGITVECGI